MVLYSSFHTRDPQFRFQNCFFLVILSIFIYESNNHHQTPTRYQASPYLPRSKLLESDHRNISLCLLLNLCALLVPYPWYSLLSFPGDGVEGSTIRAPATTILISLDSSSTFSTTQLSMTNWAENNFATICSSLLMTLSLSNSSFQ